MTAQKNPVGVKKPGVKVTKRPSKRVQKNALSDANIVVHKNMTVGAIVEQFPQASEILAQYGLHCFGCSANTLETLEEGCTGHGFDERDIENLVDDINTMIASTPPRPQTLTITQPASEQIKNIAESQGKAGQGLSVLADEHGGFFMEFRDDPELGDKQFTGEKSPDVRVFASVLTLQRIGGSIIDFREGRFKLDLESPVVACGCGGKCDCK